MSVHLQTLVPTFMLVMLIDCRVEYIQLALQHKPLNLGQGFPDYYAPENVTNALAAIAKSDNPLLQQYTRGFVSVSWWSFNLICFIIIRLDYTVNLIFTNTYMWVFTCSFGKIKKYVSVLLKDKLSLVLTYFLIFHYSLLFLYFLVSRDNATLVIDNSVIMIL